MEKLDCKFDEFDKLRMSSMSWISCTVSSMSWLSYELVKLRMSSMSWISWTVSSMSWLSIKLIELILNLANTSNLQSNLANALDTEYEVPAVVSHKRKYVHELLVNRLFKLDQEKVCLGKPTVPP